MNNSDTQIPRQNTPSADTNSAEQRAAAKIGNVVRRKTRAKAPDIESVGQLLQAVYDGAFKRAALKRAELTAMRNAPKLTDRERERILGIALSRDRTLDSTRRLMLLADKLDAPVVKGQIRRFSGDVLEHHPAFKTLTSVLRDLPEGRTEDQSIRYLASQDYASLSWPEKTDPLKKVGLARCKTNAMHCLLLWFRMTRRTSVERIQHFLEDHLWKPAASRYKTDSEKLRVLMNTRDPAAASIACALFEEQARQASQREEFERRAKRREMERAQKLNEELTDVRARLAASQVEIGRIQKKLAEESQAHADDRAHLKNDYEQLRGRVLRRLREELSLLDEGLHALQRDPPKVRVMIDHAERAIDGLKDEVDRLKRRNS